MKKASVIALMMVFVLSGSTTAAADGYAFLGLGSGGEVEATSVGVDFGAVWPKESPRFLLGLSLSGSFTSESKKKTALLDEVRAPEFELAAVAGLAVVRGLFLVGSAGYSQSCTGTVFSGDSASECTNYDDNDVQNHLTWSGQVRYLFDHLILGGGFHNRRGPFVGLGLRF